MDGQQYLDQITPSAAKNGGILSILKSKIGILLIAGVIITIAIIIIGSALKPAPVDVESDSISLKIQIDNFSKTVQTYRSKVKSPELQTTNNNLGQILSTTSRELLQFLTDEYKFTDKSITEEISTPENEYSDNLDSELFAASTGQFFDRAYARKVAIALNRLMDTELSLHGVSKNDALKNLLAESYNSLITIYEQLTNYSE